MSARLRLLVLAATVALIAGGCGPTDNAELKRRIETLTAIAAEGRLVADGVIGDRTKATYSRVQARTLAADAQHEAEKMGDASVVNGLQDEREKGVAIAERLSGALSALETFPGRPDKGRQARAAIAQAGAEARRLDAAIPEKP